MSDVIADDSVTASAPGSIMVTGEHAVVYGHPAIVCAIDMRITVRATRLEKPVLRVSSDIADDEEVPLKALRAPKGDFRFVQAAVGAWFSGLEGGVSLEITSTIDPTLGLGSSAAVTVATLGAMAALTRRGNAGLHRQAHAIIKRLQGRGSGADLAASLNGGMLRYQSGDGGAVFRALPTPPPLCFAYVGYKTPTGEVLDQVAKAYTNREHDLRAIYARMGGSADRAIQAAEATDWARFGEELDNYQALMAELGVSDDALDALVARARAVGASAKISGSGLGDCVLAVGSIVPDFSPAQIANEGLVLHG